ERIADVAVLAGLAALRAGAPALTVILPADVVARQEQREIVLARRRHGEFPRAERRRLAVAEIAGIVVVDQIIAAGHAVAVIEYPIRERVQIPVDRGNTGLTGVGAIDIRPAASGPGIAVAVLDVPVVAARLRIGVLALADGGHCRPAVAVL